MDFVQRSHHHTRSWPHSFPISSRLCPSTQTEASNQSACFQQRHLLEEGDCPSVVGLDDCCVATGPSGGDVTDVATECGSPTWTADQISSRLYDICNTSAGP
jgi:hypothetical protein